MALTLDQLAARLRDVAPQQLRAGVRDALGGLALLMEVRAKQFATSRLRRRSGALAGSIQGSRSEGGAGLAARLAAGGAGVAYARLQDAGGVVEAKGKKLAIPLPMAETPSGLPRYSSPRDVPGLFFFTSKAGNTIGATRDGPGLTPLFVLKERVRIEGTGFLSDAFAEGQAALPERLARVVRAALGPGGAA